MTVRRYAPPTVPTSTNARAVASYSITLDGGVQPNRALTIRQHLDTPLPKGWGAVVLRGAGPRAGLTVLDTHLAKHRTEIVATTNHLTGFTDWVMNTNRVVGGFLSTRADKPDCEGRNPDWVDSVSYLDQQGDPPLLVCSGRDPNNSSVLVIKVANSRGTGISVNTDTPWAWHWTGAPGGIAATAADWLSNLSDPEGRRTLYVVPGQQLHLGFKRPHGIAPIIHVQGTVSASALGYGLAWEALSDLEVPKAAKWAVAGTFMSVCIADSTLDPLARAGKADLFDVATQMGTCMVENFPALLRAVKKTVSADMWHQISPKLYRAGNRIIAKANGYLSLARWSYRGMEMVADVMQDPAARAVTVFSKVRKAPAPKVAAAPGRIGSLHIGMNAEQALATGLVKRVPMHDCGFTWAPAGPLAAMDPEAEIGVDELDNGTQLHYVMLGGHAVTTAGVGVGDTLAKLRAAYGSALQPVPNPEASNGDWGAWVLFGAGGDLEFFTMNGRVWGVLVSAETRMARVSPYWEGC